MSLVSSLTDLATAIGVDIKSLRSTSGPRGIVSVSAPYTLTDADHGKLVLIDSANVNTLTFPSTLPSGFTVTVWQVGVGGINFEFSGRAVRSNASRITTTYAGDTVKVTVASVNTAVMEFATPLTTQYQANSTALSLTSTTAVSLETTSPSLVLEAGGVYEIDYRVVFQTDNTAANIRMIFPDSPGLTSVQLDYKVQLSATGASAFRHGIVTTTTNMVGSGTSSVAGIPLMGVITGRVTVGANSVTLIPQISSIGTTGIVTVAAGAATISVRKIYGAPAQPTVAYTYVTTVPNDYDSEYWSNGIWINTNRAGVSIPGTEATTAAFIPGAVVIFGADNSQRVISSVQVVGTTLSVWFDNTGNVKLSPTLGHPSTVSVRVVKV